MDLTYITHQSGYTRLNGPWYHLPALFSQSMPASGTRNVTLLDSHARAGFDKAFGNTFGNEGAREKYQTTPCASHNVTRGWVNSLRLPSALNARHMMGCKAQGSGSHQSAAWCLIHLMCMTHWATSYHHISSHHYHLNHKSCAGFGSWQLHILRR